MADERINVEITGDARSFLKASAEARKALESLSKSSIKPIKLGLDTAAFKRDIAALKPTVGVALKADIVEFQRQLLANTFTARVKLQVDQTSLNGLSAAIGAAVGGAVAPSIRANRNPAGAVAAAAVVGGVGAPIYGIGSSIFNAVRGPRKAAVSGVPPEVMAAVPHEGLATRARSWFQDSPFMKRKGAAAKGAEAAAKGAETVVKPDPGTGAAKPPGEGFQFMQAGVNPGNIMASVRAMGELAGAVGNAINRVLDLTASFTGMSRAAVNGAAVASGLFAAFAKGREHLQDVIDDERALIALQANFGTAAERVKTQIDDLAKAQPFVTDDRLMQAAALLKTFEATDDQIQALLPTITALGIVYNKDVAEVAATLANGLKGNVRGLKEFGIVLDSNATSGEIYAAVLDRAKTASKQLTMFTRNTGSAMDGASLSMGNLSKAADDFGAAFGYAFAGPSKIINFFIEKLLDLSSVLLALFPVLGSIATGDRAEALGRLGEAWKNLSSGRGAKINIAIPEPAAPPPKPGKTAAGAPAPKPKPIRLKGGGEISLDKGLVKAPPTTVSAPSKAFDFLAEFRKRVSVKELYGMGGLEGLNKAFEETEAAAKKAGATLSGPGYQEALGIVAGGKIGGLGRIAASDRAQLDLINDPMDRLRATIDLFPTQMARAQDQLSMAVTADQKLAAEDNIANITLENKRNIADYGRMVVDKNTALLTGMANVFNDFIQAFGDQIGRSLAGGAAGMSAGTGIRGVAGIAAGGLGVAGSLMPIGSTIAGLAAGPVLAAVGVAVTGVASILAGFFDQQDENAREALEKQKEQIRLQTEQNKNIAILAQSNKEARTRAGAALGTITPAQAALAQALAPFSGAALEGFGTPLGASGSGQFYRRKVKGKPGLYERYEGTATPIEGATLGKDQQALIDYFGKPENMGKLREAATQLSGGAKLGAVLGNLNIPGLAGRGKGQFGTEEQMTQTGTMLLNLFATLDEFYKDQTKTELDKELQAIGSTPRNPVYVYDVTPADQRFTFQPREAFFRASARQAGTNVTPGAANSGGR